MLHALRTAIAAVVIFAVCLSVASPCPAAQRQGAAKQDKTGKPEAEPKAQYKPPKYLTLRYNEDWSVLASRDAEAPRDWFDPIKYIRLSKDGAIWLSLGGQVRERIEWFRNFNFGTPTTADDRDVYPLTRLFYYADLHVGRYIRVFVQGKSVFATDRDLLGGRRTLDADELDLLDGFVDLSVPVADVGKFTFRVGRQELLFGVERLVSPLDWSNTRRTFDGFAGILELGDWTITGFWTRPVTIQKFHFNDSNTDANFYGIYSTGKIPKTDIGVDIYWLTLERERAVFNGTAGREQRHTLGGRVWGMIPKTQFDYEIEGAFQFGEIGNASIRAFMVDSELGYRFVEVAGKPRLYAAFAYASGDDAPGGDVETFNQLFPLGHAYLGYIDAIGRQNVIDAYSGVSFSPIKKVTVALDGHYFWRADDNDALYNAGGAATRAGAPGTSNKIGAELDLTMKYKLDRHTLVLFGYSHFFPGSFIKQTGPGDDVDFLYLSVQYTF